MKSKMGSIRRAPIEPARWAQRIPVALAAKPGIALVLALSTLNALGATGAAFGDEATKACIQGMLDRQPNPGPAKTAYFCVCFTREMNRRATVADLKAASAGDLQRLEQAQTAAVESCFKQIAP